MRRLQGVGYWVPGGTWRRGVGVLCPRWTGRGGTVLGCKSPVLSFGAVAIKQCVLVDKIYLPEGQSYICVVISLNEMEFSTMRKQTEVRSGASNWHSQIPGHS